MQIAKYSHHNYMDVHLDVLNSNADITIVKNDFGTHKTAIEYVVAAPENSNT
ncbi:hypothetical protein YC2023_087744 [Brassica napus]